MRYIKLTEEERGQLEQLHKTSMSSVVRERCLCLLLSHKGNSLVSVDKLLNIHWNTVSRLLDKWESADALNRFSALCSTKGQGAKVKLAPVAEFLPDLIEEHNRNLKPVLEILDKEYGVKVCKLTLQNFLKDAGL